jgi:hypothetical protein
MYFPWLGMLEQIRLCDTYVFYDDVQFSRGASNRVSRVQVKTRDGSRWLTVPLRDRHLHSLICELEIDDRTDWRGRHRDILRQAYVNTPYQRDMLDVVDAVFSEKLRYLSELGRASTMALVRYYGLDQGRTYLESSRLDAPGQSSERVLSLCRTLKATRYVTGHGAKRYLAHDLFEQYGIDVEYMSYQLKPYPQPHGPFTPYVTALDLIANCGHDGAHLICSGTESWRTACGLETSSNAIPAADSSAGNLEVALP